MAHSHSTDKGRQARILNRSFLTAFNAGDFVAADHLFVQERSLEIDGRRYGNKRKFEAQRKVLARRVERRELQRSTRQELFDAE